MTRRLKAIVAGAFICVAAWLSIGFEETSIDHEARYIAFVKSYPSARVVYHSYMGCDECDAPDFAALTPDRQIEFAELCRAKYGFDEPRVCNAIYAEQRKIKLDALAVHQGTKR